MAKRAGKSNKSADAVPAKTVPAKPSRIKELRQNLATAVIGAVVGALISLLSTCALLLFNERKEMREIQDPVMQGFEDSGKQNHLETKFLDAAQAARQRSSDRLTEFFQDREWQKHVAGSEAGRKNALEKAALGIHNANLDLGGLNAYEGQLSLTPKSFAAASVSILESEIAVWNALTKFAEAGTKTEEQKAFDEWVNRQSEWERSATAFDDSRTIVADSLRAELERETRVMNNQKLDYEMQMAKFNWAMAGFTISAAGLLGIGIFLFWPVGHQAVD